MVSGGERATSRREFMSWIGGAVALGTHERERNEAHRMETLIWIIVVNAFGVVVWVTAPHHEKMIAGRDVPFKSDAWD